MELATAGLYYSFPLCHNFDSIWKYSFDERRIIRGAEFFDDIRYNYYLATSTFFHLLSQAAMVNEFKCLNKCVFVEFIRVFHFPRIKYPHKAVINLIGTACPSVIILDLGELSF